MELFFPRLAVLVLLAAGLLSTSWAADPQPYDVELASTGDAAMDSTLKATSELVSLRKTAPVGPFALIARARGEGDRLKTVVESYGYYQSAVTIKIEGLGLNDAGLGDRLAALPAGQEARVSIAFQVGPMYRLRKVTLEGEVPQSAQAAFSLKSGSPAVAAEVLAAGSQLLSTLQEQGYAFAKVDPPIAYEDQTEPVLDVSFHVDAGNKITIGEIRIEGLQRVHEKVVRRRLMIHTGQQYSLSAIERARRDLQGLGPFGAINVQLGTAADSTGGVAVTFQIHERLRHAASITGAYSSDLGGSGTVTWTDRNLFGNAEQLNLAASVINLGGGTATTGVGYDTSAKLARPDFLQRDQTLQFAVGAIKQSLTAYDQKALTASVAISRKLSSVLSASVGIAIADEHIMQEGPPGTLVSECVDAVGAVSPTGLDCRHVCVKASDMALQISCRVTYNYTLISLPLGLNYDSSNLNSPLDDPLHGMRNTLSIAPTRSLGHPSTSFVITQLKLAAYFDLDKILKADPGRSVLAVRGLAGAALGASEFSLPPDQRFYGGGSGTIRGYAYQAVGPKFPIDSNPVGGTAIIAATLELRQRFGQNFGVAGFVDAGQVTDKFKLTPDVVRVGVGAGIRYYTPIGPVRVDVAFPTRKDPTDDAFEIYIGLGQAF